jgi:tetratricopeptide (TPR) repeat protein
VAATALVTLALVAAVVGTSAGLVRARRAEVLARAEQERSEKAATFLAGTLSGIDPAGMGRTLGSTLRERLAPQGRPAGGSAPLAAPRGDDVVFEGVNLIDVVRSLVDKEILGKAVERIGKELQQDPALAADLYGAVGEAYLSLDLYQPALECFERGVQLSEQARGRDDRTTNRMKYWMGSMYDDLGRARDAERVYLEVVEAFRRTRSEDAPEAIRSMAKLGRLYRIEGRLDEAEPLLRKTLEKMRRVMGADNPSTLSATSQLGLTLRDQRRYAEAEPLAREAAERGERVLGSGHLDTLDFKFSLAGVLYSSGRLEECEKLMLELLEPVRRAVGDEGLFAQHIEMRLGILYLDQGRLDEAENRLRSSVRKLILMTGEQQGQTQEGIAALARLDSLRSRGREPGPAK